MLELIMCCAISAALAGIITGVCAYDKGFKAGVSWAMRWGLARD